MPAITPAITTLTAADARRTLALRDLTDAQQGNHAIQLLIDTVTDAVSRSDTDVRLRRGNPVVTVADNYDRLGYEADAAARDARYSRYLTPDLMLRAHTSAMIPQALEEQAVTETGDVTWLCPGMVYRRDVIDRQHVGEPHQLDIWRIRTGDPALVAADLEELIATVIEATLPGRAWRAVPATHPYTLAGRQVDVADGDDWVEVGECGLAHPRVLAAAGLAPGTTGLASGWGLDRLLMLRKGIDDIRLLRSRDPRVEAQMHDLDPYAPVSVMPPAVRDLSLAMDAVPDPELLGDRLRAALGPEAADVESVEILDVTPAVQLPDAARQRIGIGRDQHNVLLRVILRSLDRTLTSDEANELRDRIYAELHAGTVHQWAGTGPPMP
jgi:phenylalanyl-tRNA synthetase alpha chain